MIFFCIFFFEVSAATFPKLKWGYVNFPPYHYGQNDKVTGTVATKIDRIFKQANLSYEATELPNKRTQVYIQEGIADFTIVIDSFIPNKAQFLKSKSPIYHIVLGAICSKENKQISSIEDLKSIDVILMSGYTYGLKKGYWIDNGFNITMQANNHADAIKALTYERGECVLGYQAPFLVERKAFPEHDFYFYPISAMPVHLFLNKKVNEAQEIMEQIDKFNFTELTGTTAK